MTLVIDDLTWGQARQVIDEVIANYDGSVGKRQAEVITYAINHELQLRDYVMGLTLNYDLDTCLSMVFSIAGQVDEAERYALLTIASSWEYELGDTQAALSLHSIVKEVSPAYSLNNLIKRVIDAGWSSNTFTSMRNDCHPKVVEVIDERFDSVIYL